MLIMLDESSRRMLQVRPTLAGHSYDLVFFYRTTILIHVDRLRPAVVFSVCAVPVARRRVRRVKPVLNRHILPRCLAGGVRGFFCGPTLHAVVPRERWILLRVWLWGLLLVDTATLLFISLTL
jgi:hypothetical protein